MDKPVYFHFPQGYPEIIEQIGQIVGRELMAATGMNEVQAFASTWRIAEAVRQHLGGAGMTYIPKGRDYELSVRDKEIWDAFTGDNYNALSRKYDLTEMQIRNIVNKARKALQRRMQPPLFGEEA